MTIPRPESQDVSIRWRATFLLAVPAEWSVPGLIELAGSRKTHDQIAKSREQALAALISKKVGTDTMLTRLAGPSDDHFDYTSDDVT
jgi:hypothetical protein